MGVRHEPVGFVPRTLCVCWSPSHVVSPLKSLSVHLKPLARQGIIFVYAIAITLCKPTVRYLPSFFIDSVYIEPIYKTHIHTAGKPINICEM